MQELVNAMPGSQNDTRIKTDFVVMGVALSAFNESNYIVRYM